MNVFTILGILRGLPAIIDTVSRAVDALSEEDQELLKPELSAIREQNDELHQRVNDKLDAIIAG